MKLQGTFISLLYELQLLMDVLHSLFVASVLKTNVVSVGVIIRSWAMITENAGRNHIRKLRYERLKRKLF